MNIKDTYTLKDEENTYTYLHSSVNVKNINNVLSMLLDMNGDKTPDKLKVVNDKLYVSIQQKNGYFQDYKME